jgi:hypothetical protein
LAPETVASCAAAHDNAKPTIMTNPAVFMRLAPYKPIGSLEVFLQWRAIVPDKSRSSLRRVESSIHLS